MPNWNLETSSFFPNLSPVRKHLLFPSSRFHTFVSRMVPVRKHIARVAVIVLAGLGAMAAFLFIISGPPDPIYDGKPLGYWLGQSKPFQPGLNNPSGLVTLGLALDVKHLDTNAIPFLVDTVEFGDGPARRKYRELWWKCPGWLKSFLPEPRDTARIRSNALLYLLNLHTFDSPMVIPAMARVLEKDDDAVLRQGAAAFLGEGHSKDPAVIQALVHGLKDPDRNVRWSSTNALRKLDPSALTNAANKL